MTATTQPDLQRTSRRALLAGALGGIGAWAASAIGRPATTRADGTTMTTGGEYTDALTQTGITNNTNNANVFYATSTHAGTALTGNSSTSTGVLGNSNSGFGISGNSTSNYGVYGQSSTYIGTTGFSSAINQPATLGYSGGNSTGVLGSSGSVPIAAAKTGVFGYAGQDANSVGVRGESPAGFGIYGKTTGTGFAGYFNGKTFMSQFVEIAEIATPAAPGGNRARLFVRDNGAGKTQLCVLFPTGAVKVLATES